MSPVDRPVRPEGDDTPEAEVYAARIARLADVLAEMENRGGVDWTFDDQARYVAEHYEIDALEQRVRDLSGLLRGMARRVGQFRETAAVLDDPDAVDGIRQGQVGDAGTGVDLRSLATGSETSPARGDDVEAWLKQQRDFYDFDTLRHLIIDELLDDYRLHADTGTPLSEHACDGPTCCYDLLEARAALAARAATPAETTEH